MSTVAEEIISQVTLDDRQFQARARPMIQTAASLTFALNTLKAAVVGVNQAMGAINFGGGNVFNIGKGSMGGGAGNIYFPGAGGGGGGGGNSGGFGNAILGANLFLRSVRMIEHALMDAGHEFVNFSEEAFKEFASFDTVEKAFEGVYGSTQKAAQMMTYLKDQAMTSAFQMRDLADAARGLAVTGLDVNRFLPIVQGFALAAGNISGSGLEDFVSILRRIEGGNTGFALGPRGIGRYGVSRREMEEHGAKFGGPNGSHFEGTVSQAFDVVEAVFKARIEKIAQSVTASSEVVLSNWKDAVQLATIDFGAGIAQNLIAPIKQLTGATNALRQSGVFKDLSDTLFSILGVDQVFGDSDKLETKFKNKADQLAYEKDRFGESGADAFGHAGLGRTPTTTGDKTQDLLIDIGGYLVTLVEFVKLEYEELADLFNFFRGLSGIDWDTMSQNDSPFSNALRAGDAFRQEAYYRSRNNWADRVNHPDNYKAPKAPGGNEIPGMEDDPTDALRGLFGGGGNKQTGLLDQIAHNTKSIHERMSKFAFGGSDGGRRGLTLVDLGNHASGRLGKLLNYSVLEDYIDLRVMEKLAHLHRQGGY